MRCLTLWRQTTEPISQKVAPRASTTSQGSVRSTTTLRPTSTGNSKVDRATGGSKDRIRRVHNIQSTGTNVRPESPRIPEPQSKTGRRRTNRRGPKRLRTRPEVRRRQSRVDERQETSESGDRTTGNRGRARSSDAGAGGNAHSPLPVTTERRAN